MKLRVRRNVTAATQDGETLEVVLPRAIVPLNDYIALELVEDHPTFVTTAQLDPDISLEELHPIIRDALENTTTAHEPELRTVTAQVGEAQGELFFLEGESPWVTLWGYLLIGRWSPLPGYEDRGFRVSFPNRNCVLFIPEPMIEEQPFLEGAHEELTRRMYEGSEPRERIFHGTFRAISGRIVPSRDYGEAAAYDLDDVGGVAPYDHSAVLFASVRRLLSVLCQLFPIGGDSMAVAMMAELAADSLSEDGQFSGDNFLGGTAVLLSTVLETFPELVQPPLGSLVAALRQGDEADVHSAITGVYRSLVSQYEDLAELIEVEPDLQTFEPWLATQRIDPALLDGFDRGDLMGLGIRVGWQALRQLRGYLGPEFDNGIRHAAAHGLVDGLDRWPTLIPRILFTSRGRIDTPHMAARFAFERTTAALSLFYDGLVSGLGESSLRVLLGDLLLAWQWQRNVFSTPEPTTPLALPVDMDAELTALFSQWREHGGLRWMDEWMRRGLRVRNRIDVVHEHLESGEPVTDALRSHARACQDALPGLRSDPPPESSDATEQFERDLADLDEQIRFSGAEFPETPTFLDGTTVANLDDPDPKAIVSLMLASVALTCGLVPLTGRQQDTLRGFLEDPPTPALRNAIARWAGDDPPLGLAMEFVQVLSEVDEDTRNEGVAHVVYGGIQELGRAEPPDGAASIHAMRALLQEIAESSRGWFGLGSSMSRAAKSNLESALELLAEFEASCRLRRE